MTNFDYKRKEPKQECPYCGYEDCFADWVSVGFSEFDVQCGPYFCKNCGAFEIGPEIFEDIDMKDKFYKDINEEIKNTRNITEEELRKGWYKPGTSPLVSSGNIIDGNFCSHEEMKSKYKEECIKHPEKDRGEIWKEIREEPH